MTGSTNPFVGSGTTVEAAKLLGRHYCGIDIDPEFHLLAASRVSENPDLYTDIIDPIGYRAKEHNEQFIVGRAALENRLTGEFITAYCDSSGAINWERFVQANSRNLDLDKLLPKN